MSARHSSPPPHNPTSTLDSELSSINSGCIDVPCEIWIEIAELADGIDVLSLSSVRRFLSPVSKHAPKADLESDLSDVQDHPFVPVLESVLDPIPPVRMPKIWGVSADLPGGYHVDFSDQKCCSEA
jgi:hypothetical protein